MNTAKAKTKKVRGSQKMPQVKGYLSSGKQVLPKAKGALNNSVVVKCNADGTYLSEFEANGRAIFRWTKAERMILRADDPRLEPYLEHGAYEVRDITVSPDVSSHVKLGKGYSAATREKFYAQDLGIGIGDQYNIAASIVRAANARKNLDATATGGGLDYICRTLDEEKGYPILVMHGGDCGSPDRLSEKSGVTLYLGEDWNSPYIDFQFETAVEALDFMSGFNGTEIDLTGMEEAQ